MPSIFEKFFSTHAANIEAAQISPENSPTSKRLFSVMQREKQPNQSLVFKTVSSAVLNRFEDTVAKVFSMLPQEQSKKYINKFKINLTFVSCKVKESYQAAVCDDETFVYLCEVTQSVEQAVELIKSEVDSVVKFFCGRLSSELKKHFEFYLQESVSLEDLHKSPRPN